MTGQRFGKLVVEEMIYGYYVGGKKRTVCKCKCDCGGETIKESSHLQTRPDQSCGCDSNERRAIHNRTNEIGNTYGYLTIVDIDYTTKPSTAICKCKCGNIVSLSKIDVVSLHTQSCGCFQRERAAESNTKDHSGEISDTGVEIIRPLYQSTRGKWIWECKCPVCKNLFEALPAKILENGTTSCGCKIQSSGEVIIENYLQKYGLKYERQKRFPDCKYIYTLPFDFAVYNDDGSLKCLIEYDGKQHFICIDFYGGEEAFVARQRNDGIKNEYCKNNNIPLIRIDYNNKPEDIEKIITNIMNP